MASDHDHPHPIFHNRAESNSNGGGVTGLSWTKEIIPRGRGAIWIMVGRPRKIGKRERNGRIARVYENPKAQVAAQPHRLDVLSKYREWPEVESEFGRLMLRGGITPAQKEAGEAYARLAAALRAVYDAESPNPRAIDLTNVRGSNGREITSEEAEQIKERSRRAFEACGEAGNRAPRAVKEHVILDRPVADFETLKVLKSGLDKLVTFFGIDRSLQISSRAK